MSSFKILVAIVVVCSHVSGLSQSTFGNKTISAKDSVRIKNLYSKAFECDTHSQKRQAYLDSIIMVKHDLAYVWQQKAMPLFKQKKHELGMSFLDSAVKYDHTYKWLEYRAFIKCIFQRSYRAAMVDLIAAEKRNPGGVVMDHSYDFYMGLSLLQLNKFDSAEKYVNKSIKAGIARANEGHFLEYLYLGIVGMEKSQYDSAVTAFDKALAGYGHFSDAKYYKAVCLEAMGRETESMQLLKEALVDLNLGYTITEDNVTYEEYPYQVKKYWIVGKIKKSSSEK